MMLEMAALNTAHTLLSLAYHISTANYGRFLKV